jgi:hypothetical protein
MERLAEGEVVSVTLKSNERGNILLGFVVAIVLTTSLLFYFIAGFGSKMSLNQQLIGSDAALLIEPIIRAEVARRVGRFVEAIGSGNCADDSLPSLFRSTVFAASNGSLSFTPIFNTSSLTPQYQGDPNHEAAKQRCSQDQTFLGDSGNLAPDSSGIYFCMNVLPGSNDAVDQGAIFQYPPVFAEVYYAFWDFRAGAPASCASFQSSYERGGQIFYTLYWQGQVAHGRRYFAYTDSIYAKSHY